jgi:Ran-binding protein 3
MRAAGHFRLILNAALYPGMVVSVMDGGKGVSFACVNTADAAGASADVDKGGKEKAEKEGAAKGGMRTFAVRLRGADAEERTVAFKAAIDDALSRLPAKTSAAKADDDEEQAEKGEKAAAGEEAV